MRFKYYFSSLDEDGNLKADHTFLTREEFIRITGGIDPVEAGAEVYRRH